MSKREYNTKPKIRIFTALMALLKAELKIYPSFALSKHRSNLPSLIFVLKSKLQIQLDCSWFKDNLI